MAACLDMMTIFYLAVIQAILGVQVCGLCGTVVGQPEI